MEYMNQAMKEIGANLSENNGDYGISDINFIISPNIIETNGCFILDLDNTLNIEKINWKRVMKMHGDKTGYEASCNEIRINDYIENNDRSKMNILNYGYKILDGWERKLKSSFPQHKFVLILSYDQLYATIRFYKFREEDASWLSKDLEKYCPQAILVREI